MSLQRKSDYKISVIVPVHNTEAYLAECLESLTIQSFGMENFEVIMIDDCSTDHSGSIMDRYSAKYGNFVSIHLPQNSGGAGHPRNIGIQKANGKFIMFLDSDDKYIPDTCKIMYDAINLYDSDIVLAGHNYFNSNMEGYFKLVDEIVINTSLLKQPDLVLKFPPCVWSKIFRKEMLLKHDISFPTNAIGEDAVFTFKYLMAANKITVLPVSVCKYRLRSSDENPSLTQIVSRKFFKEYNCSMKRIMNIAEEYRFDYIGHKFHQDIDYAFWMLNRSQQMTEEEIASILEELYWFVEKGEDHLPKCRISDKIIIKKILNKDFAKAAKAFLSFSEFRELEAVIVQQQNEIAALKEA